MAKFTFNNIVGKADCIFLEVMGKGWSTGLLERNKRVVVVVTIE